MITITLNQDLTIASIVTEQVFQGSLGVNTLELLAEMPNTYNVQLAIKVPDGLNTVLPMRAMTYEPNYSDNDLNMWRYTFDSDITEFAGEVEFTIYVFSGTGQLVTTGITTLLVEETIAPAPGYYNVIDASVGITSVDINPAIATNQKQFNEYVAFKLVHNENVMFYVKFTEAVSKGQAIQFAGVQGGHLLAKKAVPSEINDNPEYMMGIAYQNASTNAFGYVLEFGTLKNLRTDIFGGGEGSILYFASDGTTPGALTSTKPTVSRQYIIMAALVTLSSGNSGILQVRLGSVATEVIDIRVQATQPTNQQANDFWYDISNNP
jgi:hypothetical protein